MSRQAVIQSHLEALMQQVLEVEELHVADNGSVHVTTDLGSYTVRVCPSCPEPHIEVFSVAVRDVAADPGLYEAVNDLNRVASHARLFWTGERVIVAGELLGASADVASLRCLCNEVAGLVDREAPKLAEVFGGVVGEED